MKTILKRIIADFHHSPFPWFRRRQLDVPVNLEKVITIIGPRRAGKHLLFFISSWRIWKKNGVPRHRMLYLNFEDERIVLEGKVMI